VLLAYAGATLIAVVAIFLLQLPLAQVRITAASASVDRRVENDSGDSAAGPARLFLENTGSNKPKRGKSEFQSSLKIRLYRLPLFEEA